MKYIKLAIIVSLLASSISQDAQQVENRTEVFRGTVFEVKGKVVIIMFKSKVGLKQGLLVNYLEVGKDKVFSTGYIFEVGFTTAKANFTGVAPKKGQDVIAYKEISTPIKSETKEPTKLEIKDASDEIKIGKLTFDSSSNKSGMSWDVAMSYCQNQGKRLPTRNELEINWKALNDTGYHWTSSELEDDSSKAYIVILSGGSVSIDPKDYEILRYVRCVR